MSAPQDNVIFPSSSKDKQCAWKVSSSYMMPAAVASTTNLLAKQARRCLLADEDARWADNNLSLKSSILVELVDQEWLLDKKTHTLNNRIRLATSIINSPAPTRPSVDPPHRPEDLDTQNVATTSNSIILAIKDEEQLKVDGSNWSTWVDNTKECMQLAVNNSKYLQTWSYNHYCKQVVRPIMLASVSQPLKRMLQKCLTNQAMCKTLQEHFHNGNRSSQMRLYCKLFSFTVDSSMATSNLHCIKDLVDEFEAVGSKFTGNAIAGFVLQAGIDPSSNLYQDFENQIDHKIWGGGC